MLNSPSRSCIRCFAPIITIALLFSSVAFAQHYQQTDLVANSTSVSSTATIDPNLVNAWGLSRASGSPFWVSDNGMGVSTLYDGTGAIVPLVVTIPPPMGGEPPSAPTGTVFNFTKVFVVKNAKPAVFLFVTEDGTISGWNPASIRPMRSLKWTTPNKGPSTKDARSQRKMGWVGCTPPISRLGTWRCTTANSSPSR